MATWQELSQDNLRAAQKLVTEGHLRSSINRSYYAAYCAIAGELIARGASFAHGWNNPAHAQLPELVGNNLPLSQDTRRRLKKLIRFLRHAREDADYRPGASIHRALALDCIRSAVSMLQDVGVRNDE